MNMNYHPWKSLLLVLTLAAMMVYPVDAQKAELAVIGGYRFSGNLGGADTGSESDQLLNELKVDNNLNFGALIDYTISETIQLELLYDRQPTTLSRTNSGTGAVNSFDTTIDYLHFGFLFRKSAGTLRPFLGMTFGGTFIRPDGLQNESRTSVGIALGVKSFVSDRLGFRLQSRIMSSYFPQSSETFCDQNGNCYDYRASFFLNQIDLSAGIILSLGSNR